MKRVGCQAIPSTSPVELQAIAGGDCFIIISITNRAQSMVRVYTNIHKHRVPDVFMKYMHKSQVL